VTEIRNSVGAIEEEGGLKRFACSFRGCLGLLALFLLLS